MQGHQEQIVSTPHTHDAVAANVENPTLGYLTGHPRNQQQGFGLVEFLLTLFILSFALLGLADIFTRSLASTTVSRQRSIATTLAEQKLETIKSQKNAGKYNEILDEPNTSVGLPSGYSRKTGVTKKNSGTLQEYKEIKVTVYWADNKHRVDLSTIVAKQ